MSKDKLKKLRKSKKVHYGSSSSDSSESSSSSEDSLLDKMLSSAEDEESASEYVDADDDLDKFLDVKAYKAPESTDSVSKATNQLREIEARRNQQARKG
eukprot:Nk52_evm1s1426 gene=Nk52_evmTU1s1426